VLRWYVCTVKKPCIFSEVIKYKIIEYNENTNKLDKILVSHLKFSNTIISFHLLRSLHTSFVSCTFTNFLIHTSKPARWHILDREKYTYIHTYHSRVIPEGVAEVSQIFLRDTHVLPKLVSYEEHCRRDRW
jgi:hypothetical protein